MAEMKDVGKGPFHGTGSGPARPCIDVDPNLLRGDGVAAGQQADDNGMAVQSPPGRRVPIGVGNHEGPASGARGESACCLTHDYLCGLCCQIRGSETDGPRIITYDGKERWAQQVRVGCFSPSYQTFFHGNVSEILVYRRPLTPQERQKVTVYLMDKWGL